AFFFQAEDGIRDRNVTGVQTCALPILIGNWLAWTCTGARKLPSPLPSSRLTTPGLLFVESPGFTAIRSSWWSPLKSPTASDCGRSEERRVGKEWRCGWRWGESRVK